MKCPACAKDLDPKEGIELWGLRFCSDCFIGRSQGLNRALTPEELELLKLMGRELAGLVSPDYFEMIVAGFYKRAAGVPPPKPELERCVGELQRLTALACFTQTLNLLKNWQEIFSQFVQEQEEEIRGKMKRLTDGI